MTNIAMERSTMLLIVKLSISMGHGFHGYVSHNQMVDQNLLPVIKVASCLSDFPDCHAMIMWNRGERSATRR